MRKFYKKAIQVKIKNSETNVYIPNDCIINAKSVKKAILTKLNNNAIDTYIHWNINVKFV